MRFIKITPGLVLASLVFLTSCGSEQKAVPVAMQGLSGIFHGGQQPVSGTTIQLYAVGAGGDGTAATPLITKTITTSDGSHDSTNANANAGNAFNSLPVGEFTISGDYPARRLPRRSIS